MAESPEIQRLIQLFAKLPGLGPRSARRAVLHLLRRRQTLMEPLAHSIAEVVFAVCSCSLCGNFDTHDPCAICADAERDSRVVCVIESVADLWAIERALTFRGRYQVLGGKLSALEGVRPEDLNLGRLLTQAAAGDIDEVILGLSATVEGQTTAHYVADRLAETGVSVSKLAHGVPVGGELDYLDEGTLSAALKARRLVS